MPPVVVCEVGKGPAMRSFADLAVALDGDKPGTGWLLTAQRRRLKALSGPMGEAVLFLASRAGRPVGRLTAHLQSDGQGSFGFLVVERPGDADVVAELIRAAAGALAARGCTTILGPLSWTASEEAGVMVAGHDQAAVAGRAWTPSWYADLLEASGLEVADELCSYRLEASADASATVLAPVEFVVSPEMAPFVDPALMLAGPDGAGSVAAVPDVVGGLANLSWRGAWSLARLARTRRWAGCVVVALDGREPDLIPSLCAAAGAAGYAWVLSPWAPDDREPVMRHRLYRAEIASLLS